MHQALEGKQALVAGGGRGIGAAIVERLASEGAKVTFTYASSQNAAEQLVKQVAAAGGRAHAVPVDSADRQQLRELVQDVASSGGLDIVVANAGGGVIKPLSELDDAAIDRMIDVNIRGTVDLVRFAIPQMRSGGRVVTIGSVSAHYMPDDGTSVYGMTKAAVASLVQGLARELGPRGITVNNVQPGPVDTDANPADGPAADWLRSLIPVGRFGTTDEVASLVAYLASDAASLINGTSIDIDGGYSS
ncbi:oxidoreductase [Kribbella sp. ALI-6-A]|uniref:SDR family NAD(P)-dependent oxidoreductase n=1 Tax=Kribbella sp. ALI-6-A TaxID=1933817 RepID=UPI00097C9A1C|nr:SDR family oxidoreductase [Kribbella sp. ALI-6-A]ONI75907.1 oxidoreductase [Kribbella sp. ALI-6-A]